MTDENRQQAIGQALAAYRREVGMSQRELASALGVGVGWVRGWERGTRDFHMHELFPLSAALGVDPVDLTARLRQALTMGII